jgi:hypothetical protein
MEIQVLPKNSIRIKGRHGSIGINPTGKHDQFNAVIFIGKSAASQDASIDADGILVINGPGEYEISGIKISGVRIKSDTVYSVTVDGVESIIGTIHAISNGLQKTKEHHIVIIDTDESMDAAFVTSVASNAVVFYGDHALEVVNKLAKENIKHTAKYQASADKLPSEMETVLLASSS